MKGFKKTKTKTNLFYGNISNENLRATILFLTWLFVTLVQKHIIKCKKETSWYVVKNVLFKVNCMS